MTSDGQGSRLSRFRALSGVDRRLLLRAVGWLFIARLMLVVIPFQRLAQKLETDESRSSREHDADFLRRVSLTVTRAANNVPWRSDCFPQAIAARMLLKRHGYASTIHLGVERAGEAGLVGHAWLTCGDTVITGGAELERYTELHRIKA